MTNKTTEQLIILEGSDCSGKSTLAKTLLRDLGGNCSLFHHGPYKGLSHELSRMFLDSMLPAVTGQHPVILDRCWISESIYGPVYRGPVGDRVGPARALMLERVARKSDVIYVFCQPPIHNVIETFKSRIDDEYLDNENQLRSVYNKYDEFFRTKTGLNYIKYDYTTDKDDDVVDRIAELSCSLGFTFDTVSSNNATGADNPLVTVLIDDLEDWQMYDSFARFAGCSLSPQSMTMSIAYEIARRNIPDHRIRWAVLSDVDTTKITYHVMTVGSQSEKLIKKMTLKSNGGHSFDVQAFPEFSQWGVYDENGRKPSWTFDSFISALEILTK